MRHKFWTCIWAGAAILLFVVAIPEAVFAQSEPEWYLDLNNFQDNITLLWRNRAYSIGLTIFSLLATLDLIVLGIGLLFSDENVDLFNTILRRLIFIAFLFGVLSSFWVLESLVAGFQQMAFAIFDQEWNLNEFQILEAGIAFFQIAQTTIGNNLGWTNFFSGSAWVARPVLLLVLFGFVILAIQYAYISLKVLISLTFSPLFLSFLPFKITRPWSEGYISYIIRIGIQLFLFYMVFFFFWSVLIEIINNVQESGDFGYTTLMGLGFMTYLSIFCLYKIPVDLSTAVTGNQNIDIGKFLNRISEV